jgi:hypothetical protein
MYASLKDMHSLYQQNVSTLSGTLDESTNAIDIVEKELNASKKRLNLLEAQKNNTLRLVEINTYYGKRYRAHSKLMKTIVFICIPIIILSILANKGIVPPNIHAFLVGIIIFIGIFFIGLQLIDISNRDNMNWDEYNWYFDRESAPTASESSSSSSDSNPWATSSFTCVGAACCYDGSTYDETHNICVPNVFYNQQNPETTTESFKGLDKYAYTQDKPIMQNNNVKPVNASFSKF